MVSVIVPNYNHAPFLRQRLDSIFNQTFQDFEVILLDDASSDGSLEILQTYAQHPKVSHLIVNPTNSGSPFRQWQRGIERANGELLWVAESDDWADERFLEIMVAELQQNPDVVMAYSDFISIDTHDRQIEKQSFRHVLKDKIWDSSYRIEGLDEIRRHLIYHNTVHNTSTVVFRKATVEKILPQVPDFRFSPDWVLWLLLLPLGKIAYINQPLGYYRKSLGGITYTTYNLATEKKRFRETIACITLARRLSRPSVSYLNPYYHWLPATWHALNRHRRHRIGYYFPPFPFLLILHFYLFLIKISAAYLLRKIKLNNHFKT